MAWWPGASARSAPACVTISDTSTPGDAAMAPADLRDMHGAVAALDQCAARLLRRLGRGSVCQLAIEIARRRLWIDRARAAGAEMNLGLCEWTDDDHQRGDREQFFHGFYDKSGSPIVAPSSANRVFNCINCMPQGLLPWPDMNCVISDCLQLAACFFDRSCRMKSDT